MEEFRGGLRVRVVQGAIVLYKSSSKARESTRSLLASERPGISPSDVSREQ